MDRNLGRRTTGEDPKALPPPIFCHLSQRPPSSLQYTWHHTHSFLPAYEKGRSRSVANSFWTFFDQALHSPLLLFPFGFFPNVFSPLVNFIPSSGCLQLHVQFPLCFPLKPVTLPESGGKNQPCICWAIAVQNTNRANGWQIQEEEGRWQRAGGSRAA